MRGAAVGAERADVENGKQVQTMQLGREVKPRLSCVAFQMLVARGIARCAQARAVNAPGACRGCL
jgi:hypothetical protein